MNVYQIKAKGILNSEIERLSQGKDKQPYIDLLKSIQEKLIDALKNT